MPLRNDHWESQADGNWKETEPGLHPRARESVAWHWFLYILNTSHVSHVSLYFEFIFYTCHQMNAFALWAGGIFEACADLGISTSPFPTDDQVHL